MVYEVYSVYRVFLVCRAYSWCGYRALLAGLRGFVIESSGGSWG